MKVSILVAGITIINTVLGFADTAPFYSAQELPEQFPYITRASELSLPLNSLLCGESKVVIYRVSNLKPGVEAGHGTYIKHVFYELPEDLDVIDSTCGLAYYHNNYSSDDSNKVVVVDIEDDQAHSIDEFLTNDGTIIMVQGKPSFHKAEAKHENVISGLLRKHKRNYATSGTEEEEDKIAAEVQEDFKAAESLLAQETEIAQATILASSEEENTAPATKKTNSNLFTNYQFFSPGIWMGLIVSGFLLFILSNALSWVSALEISYKAFDKQVDYEKKNE